MLECVSFTRERNPVPSLAFYGGSEKVVVSEHDFLEVR